MNKSLVLVPVVFILAFAIVLVARLVVQTSVDVLNLPVLFGVLFGSGLLFLVFSDYSRKPRFRCNGRRNPSAPATTPAMSSDADAAAAWTYTTFSA